MVVVETALVGAAGYGVYKSGDVAIKKGKEAHREYKLDKKCRSRKNEMATKQKSRSERLSSIMNMRNNKNNSTSSKSFSSYNFGFGSKSTSAAASIDRKQDDDFNDRFKSIKEKLDTKPSLLESKKGGKKSLFGKKK